MLADHLADCENCRRLVSALARELSIDERSAPVEGPPDWLPRGSRLGRYVITEQIGVGSNGAVYAAEDPNLGRRIALKLLRAAGDGSPSVLVGEARAMAKLAHPNVVAVHDVGMAEDRVFIAMELVSGGTLRAWLDERPRTWREIREVFVAAGRGLAAAHRAGIVHRDFKPDNVLVDAEGRVRVTDFGLARTDGHEPVLADGSGEARAFIGTPAYMSPEQLRGEQATPASDQFAFCVTLYAALFGRRPFAGESIERLRESSIRAPQSSSRKDLPPRITELISTGLQLEPEARHRSMAILVDELGRERRPRRIVIGAVAAIVTVAAIGVAVGAMTRHEPEVCTGAEHKLAGIWDVARRAEVDGAFARSGLPYREAAVRHVDRTLDQYAASWIAGHVDACEATHVRRDQSERVMDQRMQCLAQRRDELRAVVQVLAIADSAIVEHAADTLASLRPVETCVDLGALDRVVPPPTELVAAAKFAELNIELARGRALKAAGKYREASDIATRVAAATATFGNPPLDAAAALLLANLQGIHDDRTSAASNLMRAIRSADAGRDDELRARAWLAKADLSSETHPEDANEAIANAEPIVGRLAGPEIRAMLADGKASVLLRLGRLDEARVAAVAAVSTLEPVTGARFRLALELARLGSIDERLGRFDVAQVELERALAIDQELFGPDHPAIGKVLSDLANLANSRDDVPKAKALYERVLANYLHNFGADNTAVGFIHYQLGHTLSVLGELAGAETHLRRAIAIATAVTPPDQGLEANALDILGKNFGRAGKLDQALATHRRVLEIQEARHDIRNIAAVEYSLGMDYASLARPRDALSHFERAVTSWESFLGPDHLHLSFGLHAIGELLLELDRPVEALAILERAAKIRTKAPLTWQAETNFALGRAHWVTGDHVGALVLVKAARGVYAGDPGYVTTLASIDRWLKEHPASSGGSRKH